VVIVFMLVKDKLPSINIEMLLENVSDSLGAWTYLLVGGLAFLETGAFVGLIAPGEFTVILGGAVAGQGRISLPLIIAVTWASAFAGDSVSFLIGHRLGRKFLIKHGPRVGISEKRLNQVETYFDRHGGKTILIGRFIGLVRALAPFIAGSSRMRYSTFAPYSILGTGVWATGLILIGYFSSRSIDEAAGLVGRGLLAFGIFVGIIVGITLLVRYLREPENRREVVKWIESRRLLRPLLALGRRLRPEAEFLWRRFTPGMLGLELTTLLAVIAVGSFVLVAYISIVSGDPGPTPGDSTAMRLVEDHLRSGWLTDVAKTVTALGPGAVIWPLTLIAGVVLAMRGRYAEAVVLVAGMVMIVIATHVIKAAVDRPRPAGGLVDASDASFPSAHAAYSTLYTYLATIVAVHFARPGVVARGAVIGAGLAVTALVGLSRVYLGVHYLSDVTAGWALGFTAFALAATVALVATHIRQNAAADDDLEPVSAGPRGARD
jgi:membrane protein DedA with SNARE-associated domain/membrane-associated phospholipid phosphatase